MTGWGEVFEAAAGGFHRWDDLVWGPMGRELSRAAQARPGAKVLDACCGAGSSALPAAFAVGSTGHVDAVDLSPSLVEQTARRARDEGLTTIRARQGDVMAWTEDGYDVVQSGFGVFFLPDPVAGGRHLVERLRPGGRIAITTWGDGALSQLSEVVRAARCEVGPPATGPSTTAGEFATAHQVAEWLGTCGAVDSEVREIPHRIVVDADQVWELVEGSGMQSLLGGLDDPARRAFRDEVSSRWGPGAREVAAPVLLATGRRPSN